MPVTRGFVRAGVALLCAALTTITMATTAAAAPSGRARVAITVPPRGGSGASPDTPICNFGACYNYVAASQQVNAAGAIMSSYQAKPQLDPGDSNAHSLQELAVESADGQQIVEVGWTVDRGLNGDARPHLFTFYWVDGNPTCYNTCGFVSTDPSVQPGQPVAAGSFGTFGIVFRNNRWSIRYGTGFIGYYPASLWQGRFTRFGLVQAFGEVAATGMSSCSDMGNGRFGTDVHSSSIKSFRLVGGAAAAHLTVTTVTTPQQYDSGFATATSYHLGGPGNGRC